MEYLESYIDTSNNIEKDYPIYILCADHQTCNPDYMVGPEYSNNYKIVLVVKGRGELEQCDKKFYIEEGDIFALFPDKKYKYYSDPNDPWEIIWISFNGRICEGIMSSINLTQLKPIVKNIKSQVIIQLFRDINQ
jgi:AraC family transcriptional regulator, arabinose operon regulatory protein